MFICRRNRTGSAADTVRLQPLARAATSLGRQLSIGSAFALDFSAPVRVPSLPWTSGHLYIRVWRSLQACVDFPAGEDQPYAASRVPRVGLARASFQVPGHRSVFRDRPTDCVRQWLKRS